MSIKQLQVTHLPFFYDHAVISYGIQVGGIVV